MDKGRARYRAVDCSVYQGGTKIAECWLGDQGQLPSDIAERIADLLNADFERFCVDVCAGHRPMNPIGDV